MHCFQLSLLMPSSWLVAVLLSVCRSVNHSDSESSPYLLRSKSSLVCAPLHLLLIGVVWQLVYLIAQQFGQFVHLNTLQEDYDRGQVTIQQSEFHWYYNGWWIERVIHMIDHNAHLVRSCSVLIWIPFKPCRMIVASENPGIPLLCQIPERNS